jgi:hypothetical protein
MIELFRHCNPASARDAGERKISSGQLLLPEPGAEKLQRSFGLRRLVGADHDAVAGEVGPEIASELEDFFRQALGGDFQDE